jgi:SAM-dependent methyltransferase
MSYFDHFALTETTAVGSWIVRRTKHREFSLVRPYLSDTRAAILEIGAGKGELAQCYLEAGYQAVVAVEPHPVMRSRLESQGMATRDYSVPPIREGNASYDAVVCSDFLEHLNDTDEARQFVAEAGRVLRPGGLLCLAAPDYLHWHGEFFHSDYTHAYITTVRRTMQLLYDHGFEPIYHAYLSGFLVGVGATVMSHIVRLGLFFPTGNAVDSKLYKLKLTFLRRFFVVGKKHG